MNSDKITELKRIIDDSNDICVFTGAGISVPSGIPDFRSADGLYNQDSGLNIRPEEIISHSFFTLHTDLFYEFYKTKMLYPTAQPNAAHLYFAELARQGKHVPIVTQNIDGLHTAAGSPEVYEIHGSVKKNTCLACHAHYGMDVVVSANGVPHCPACGGLIKPDVVLYEEPLYDDVVEGAVNAISHAETLIIIGTSLVVYPAASYIRYFRGNNIIIINKSKTQMDGIATLAFYDDVTDVVKLLKK